MRHGPTSYVTITIVTAVCACQSSSTAEPDGPAGTLILLETNERRAFSSLAVRDGDGPWTALEPMETAFFVQSDRYMVAAMCDGDARFYGLSIAGATVGDGPDVLLNCHPPLELDNSEHVTGTMTQPGTVLLHHAQSSTMPNWSYDFTTYGGKHALVALDDTRSFHTFIDVEASPMTIPDIDLDTVGTPLVARPYTLADVAVGADVSSQIIAIMTAPQANFSDVQLIPSVAGSTLRPLPTSYFNPAAGDLQQIEIIAKLGTVAQVVDVDANAPDVAFDLPPNLDVTFADGLVTWNAPLPPGTSDLNAFTSVAGHIANADISVTRSWAATTNTVSFDVSKIPGVDVARLPDMSAANLMFVVTSSAPGVLLSSVAGNLGPGLPAGFVTPVPSNKRLFVPHRFDRIESRRAIR